MAIAAAVSGQEAPNHPRAVWMGLIAGIAHNMVIGCLMGSFSVMLASVEGRMGVTREMSSSVGALVIFGSALIASIVGPLMARYSLRWLMFFGGLLSVAGYLILAYTNSYALYVGSYLLLFGPSMAIAGSVGPATLVTRWFSRNRGLALGLVHLSLVVAVMPLLCNWVLETYGAREVYLMMAVLIGVTLLPAALAIQDHPPVSEGAPNAIERADGVALAEAVDGAIPGSDPVGEAEHELTAAGPAADEMMVGEILRSGAFWSISIAAGLVITAIMLLTFNMIPLAESLGIDRNKGAILQATMALCGMAGSIIFGWVADRIGGARGIALLALNMAVLLVLLVFGNLPYAGLLVVIGLLGLHGAGMVPNVSRALAHSLGQGSFSRAFGLQSALSVPFTAIGIWAMGASFTRTGSYTAAISGVALVLLVAVPMAFSVRGKAFSRA
ncbi:MAG: MFS transporter [Novosphingobium sp.]|nr:MFS transporter [Novosphingobium sp.]